MGKPLVQFAIALACSLAANPQEVPVFGTTVVLPGGLKGNIYFLHRHRHDVPHSFDKMRPEGTIYTSRLDVPPQSFDKGFPGITDRFEWFAIDYTGRFYIKQPGQYRFRLTSDDGSYLYIDGDEIIDNGGMHPPETQTGVACLSSGTHTLRVSYFQGPKFQVALVLQVQPPGRNKFEIFDTDDFTPPAGDPSDWPPIVRVACAEEQNTSSSPSHEHEKGNSDR